MSTRRGVIGPSAAAQQAMWAGYLLALAIICAVAWKVGSAHMGIGLPIWEKARTAIYGVAVICGIGALWLRHSVYARAEQVRADFARESATLNAEELEAPLRKRLNEALAELALRERSVWTLCVGPALLCIPSVLFSGDARPMIPLAVASLVLLILTFPRTNRFAAEIRGREVTGLSNE